MMTNEEIIDNMRALGMDKVANRFQQLAKDRQTLLYALQRVAEHDIQAIAIEALGRIPKEEEEEA